MTKNSYSASILARTAKLSVLCNELVENYHINPGSIHIAIRLPKCISLEEYHSWCKFRASFGRTPLSFPEQGVNLSLEAWTYLEWSNLFSVETLDLGQVFRHIFLRIFIIFSFVFKAFFTYCVKNTTQNYKLFF